MRRIKRKLLLTADAIKVSHYIASAARRTSHRYETFSVRNRVYWRTAHTLARYVRENNPNVGYVKTGFTWTEYTVRHKRLFNVPHQRNEERALLRAKPGVAV